MSKSTKIFKRWETDLPSTWTFQVFDKYNNELNEMIWADKARRGLVYESLGKDSAQWKDKASKHFKFDVPVGEECFSNLKDWSNFYNKFQNWTNLNALMAISSNFETYLATVVELALESDPGVVFESSKSIDGIEILKNEGRKNIFREQIITSLTQGDWNSRTNEFKKYFGTIPENIELNISDLEKIRVMRNNVGHAFGRDIKESRNHEVKTILSMESLSNERLKKYQKIIWLSARSIDLYLLKNHIGEYQAAAFYHRIYDSLRKDIHQSERAIILKKRLGDFGDISGKKFCKGLVRYYEKI